MGRPAGLPPIDPGSGITVFEPETTEMGHWVGAPCVHVHDGRTYLAVRERDQYRRGHAIVIYEWIDRDRFESVNRIPATDLDASSVERPAMVTDPDSGALKLYVPVDCEENDWRIRKLTDAPEPAEFDASTAVDVLQPAVHGSDSATVKDPVVLVDGDRFFMLYAGHSGTREQAHLATSVDGEHWKRSSANPILQSRGWHNHHTRISCVIPSPTGKGWVLFYDGSGRDDYGRTWNLRTGIATAHDFATITDHTPDKPAFTAPTADRGTADARFSTCRYLDILVGDAQWDVFAEVAREDEAFELRHTTIPIHGA